MVNLSVNDFILAARKIMYRPGIVVLKTFASLVRIARMVGEESLPIAKGATSTILSWQAFETGGFIFFGSCKSIHVETGLFGHNLSLFKANPISLGQRWRRCESKVRKQNEFASSFGMIR